MSTVSPSGAPMRLCRRGPLLALALTAALAVAELASSPAAPAAEYVGELFPPQHECAANTFLQTGVSEGSAGYTIPTYGAITSWSFYTGPEAVPGLALKVGHPDGGGLYTIVGESVAKSSAQLPNQVNTFPADILVEPGDVIGIYTTGSAGLEQFCGTAAETAADTYMYALGNWGPGTTALFDAPQSIEALPAYGLFPVQALVSLPPATVLPLGECSDGTLEAIVNVDYGTVPKALHYTVDGGPELTAKANSGTGAATIKGLPPGTDALEWWGEDKAGDQELPHHTASVLVTKEKPKILVMSDQNKVLYNHGERGSVSVHASSPYGLLLDPSTAHVPIDTSHAGFYPVPATATNGCGTTSTETFTYSVAPIERHLKLSHKAFATTHGHAPYGTSISYTTTDPGSTSFAIVKGVPGVRRGRRCVAARKGRRGGKPCTHFGGEPVGEFSEPDGAGANRCRFTGRVDGRVLRPGTYRLDATPATGGIQGSTLSTTFAIVR